MNIVEKTLCIFMLRLKVGEGCFAPGTPVNNIVVAVDKPFVIESHEDLTDCSGESLIHGEPLSRPVAGAAKPLELFDNRITRLRFPLPYPLDEFFSTHFIAVKPFFCQFPLDYILCCDARVVSTGDPECIETRHSVEPGNDILEC